MKLKFALLISFLIFISSFFGISKTLAFSGSGDGLSISTAFQITTCTQLQEMKDDLDAFYILKNDIDCSETDGWNESGGIYLGFDPIGTCTDDGNNGCEIQDMFTGHFDGQGKNISGLYINRTESSYVGLFGVANGEIHDVDLTNVDIVGADRTGGLVGRLMPGGSINDTNITGRIDGHNYTGGLVGGSLGDVSNCQVDVEVSGYEYTGGLIGGLSGSEGDIVEVSNSFSTGTVDGNNAVEEVGGLIGVTDTYTTVSGSHSTSNVIGNWTVGGLIGSALGSVIDCYAEGNVTSEFDGYGIGGLVGYLENGLIENSYAIGIVQANKDQFSGDSVYAGGLVGVSDGGTISKSYATGDVSGNGIRVGGLVGGTNSIVENCYARGNVSGFDRVGGLVGGLSGQITNSYSTGTVNADGGASYFGGLVGLNIGTISGSYWDLETSNESGSNGGTGKMTSEMKTQATFSSWDFENVWGIGIGTNDGYPFLSWQITEEEQEEEQGQEENMDEPKKAKIDSWSALLISDQSSCPEKLKLTIKGKHFNSDTDVKIGEKKASWVGKDSSKKIVAKFCLDKIQKAYLPGTSKTVGVKNSDTEWVKAKKKIDLYAIIRNFEGGDDFDPNTIEGVRNIQKALVKLSYLDSKYITGFYGSITMEAVKKFQTDNGIVSTGFVGPLTRIELKDEVS